MLSTIAFNDPSLWPPIYLLFRIIPNDLAYSFYAVPRKRCTEARFLHGPVHRAAKV